MLWQQTGYRSADTSEAGVEAFLTACASIADERERTLLDLVEAFGAAAEDR